MFVPPLIPLPHPPPPSLLISLIFLVDILVCCISAPMSFTYSPQTLNCQALILFKSAFYLIQLYCFFFFFFFNKKWKSFLSGKFQISSCNKFHCSCVFGFGGLSLLQMWILLSSYRCLTRWIKNLWSKGFLEHISFIRITQ